MAPDQTLYAATDDGRVVALAGDGLARKAVHRARGARYVSAPIIIDYEGDDYLAVAAEDGSLSLFAAADLADGPVHKTSADPAGFSSDALGTWRDAANVTWVLAPKAAAIEAWKIVEADGKPSLERGWTAAVDSPLAPIVANGVVFAASAGDAAKATVVSAFNGPSGEKLWDSGDTIDGRASTGGLVAGPNTIYFGTHDGTLHAFGFPIEH